MVPRLAEHVSFHFFQATCVCENSLPSHFRHLHATWNSELTLCKPNKVIDRGANDGKCKLYMRDGVWKRRDVLETCSIQEIGRKGFETRALLQLVDKRIRFTYSDDPRRLSLSSMLALSCHTVAHCFIAFVGPLIGGLGKTLQVVVSGVNCYRQEYHRSRRTVSVKATSLECRRLNRFSSNYHLRNTGGSEPTR